jgi:glycosyltransferase involved in cell wall biosynthesis
MPKLLIVANWDWVIYNFRLALAHEAREQGFEVVLVCPDGKYSSNLEEEGFRRITWSLERRSLNVVSEIRSVLSLAQIYRDERPDLIHHDTIKPNVYGSLATWLNRTVFRDSAEPSLINSFMGIGYMFSDRAGARLLRSFVLPLMRFSMQRDYAFTTFSNRGDLDTFLRHSLVDARRADVMVSEFVDIELFEPDETYGRDGDASKPLRVVMAARLLWDKGVEEFVEAGRILRDEGADVEFVLAGEPDEETPGFVPRDQLKRWDEEGVIRWIGYCSDMPGLLRRMDVAVLPTYYNEGLPRFLVESAASGLPLVTTDIPACRRVCIDGENGSIVEQKSGLAIADAVRSMITDPAQREVMGQASRNRAVECFAEHEVVDEWIDLYRRVS